MPWSDGDLALVATIPVADHLCVDTDHHDTGCIDAFWKVPIEILGPVIGERAVVLDQRSGAALTSPGPAPDDLQAKRTFDATTAGKKLTALEPIIKKIVDACNDAPTPGADARINAAILKRWRGL